TSEPRKRGVRAFLPAHMRSGHRKLLLASKDSVCASQRRNTRLHSHERAPLVMQASPCSRNEVRANASRHQSPHLPDARADRISRSAVRCRALCVEQGTGDKNPPLSNAWGEPIGETRSETAARRSEEEPQVQLA